MKTKDFFGKFCSLYVWGNLLAMGLVIAGVCFGVKYGLLLYPFATIIYYNPQVVPESLFP